MRRLRPVLKVVLSSLAHSLDHRANITIFNLDISSHHLEQTTSYTLTRDNLAMVLITLFIIFGIAVYFIKFIFGASYLHCHEENTH